MILIINWHFYKSEWKLILILSIKEASNGTLLLFFKTRQNILIIPISDSQFSTLNNMLNKDVCMSLSMGCFNVINKYNSGMHFSGHKYKES